MLTADWAMEQNIWSHDKVRVDSGIPGGHPRPRGCLLQHLHCPSAPSRIIPAHDYCSRCGAIPVRKLITLFGDDGTSAFLSYTGISTSEIEPRYTIPLLPSIAPTVLRSQLRNAMVVPEILIILKPIPPFFDLTPRSSLLDLCPLTYFCYPLEH